jgi:hypothetical protein
MLALVFKAKKKSKNITKNITLVLTVLRSFELTTITHLKKANNTVTLSTEISLHKYYKS